MYRTDNISTVLPIKYLVNHHGEQTTPQKLTMVTKTLVSNICVLVYICVVRKSTAHVDTKALNMRHQSKKGFVESLLESHNIKKVTSSTYLVHGNSFFT